MESPVRCSGSQRCEDPLLTAAKVRYWLHVPTRWIGLAGMATVLNANHAAQLYTTFSPVVLIAIVALAVGIALTRSGAAAARCLRSQRSRDRLPAKAKASRSAGAALGRSPDARTAVKSAPSPNVLAREALDLAISKKMRQRLWHAPAPTLGLPPPWR